MKNLIEVDEADFPIIYFLIKNLLDKGQVIRYYDGFSDTHNVIVENVSIAHLPGMQVSLFINMCNLGPDLLAASPAVKNVWAWEIPGKVDDLVLKKWRHVWVLYDRICVNEEAVTKFCNSPKHRI